MTEKTLDPVDTTFAAQDAASEAYGVDTVKVLRDAAHIRERPGMYIGDTGPKGLHHLVYELVYNSVDEALAGHCRNIHVKIDPEGAISVADDGRGIPVDVHPETGKSTLELVLTTLGAGAKFDKSAYKTSAGLHGMGAKAVNALAEWTEAEVRRGGKVYLQEYERGHATTPVKELGASPGNRSGTKVTFKPDPVIFHEATFDFDTLEMHLRELAYLNKGLRIKLTDERIGKEETFYAEGGVSEFVEYLNLTEDAVHKVIYIDRRIEDVNVEVALQYTTGDEERVRCYANNAYNPGGGTHMSGFRSALTRVLNTYGTKENQFKNVTPTGEDFREGLTAVVSVQVPEPQFESQTKIRLNNPEVDGYVTSVIYESLTKYMEENPKEAQKIMKKVVLAAEAREAAAKAKKALKDRKSILSGGGLPGKLMDCTTRDRDESELFLVEGGSAGGSADNGRNRHTQAILPLRGKVLNVEKARVEKVLNNEEICSLISAIGIDIGNTEDLEKLRYGKIIILTDADVDGQHIRTLLLTFFYRQMRRLIGAKRVYVARPPLYKVEQKKHTRYVQTIAEMNRELLDRGLDGTKLRVMPADGEAVEDAKTPAAIETDRLRQLMELLDELEHSLLIMERRGLSIPTLLAQIKEGKLPSYRITLGSQVHWRFTIEEVDAFRQKQLDEGRQLIVADDTAKGTNGNGNGHGEIFSVQELHEVKRVNAGLARLAEQRLKPTDLIPVPRVAGREPATRFILEAEGKQQILPHLRELVGEVRKLGERGIKVTRFKGLGEMDGDELWETTLDPAKRTLVQVQIDEASELAVDEMFRTLMGEKVEPRREFIQKHALEVKDIDYHGA
jgi:DNA gyrase subunit B